MLINRGPLPNDLHNEAFARLRKQPATNAHQGEWLFALQRAGVGLVSAPATEAILGVVPKAKAGVGSAVNDATRLLGSTLGVAVVGSVYASMNSNRLTTRLLTQLPPGLARTAHESVGG